MNINACVTLVVQNWFISNSWKMHYFFLQKWIKVSRWIYNIYLLYILLKIESYDIYSLFEMQWQTVFHKNCGLWLPWSHKAYSLYITLCMLIQMNDIVPSIFPERFIISSYCNFYDAEIYILPIVEEKFLRYSCGRILWRKVKYSLFIKQCCSK